MPNGPVGERAALIASRFRVALLVAVVCGTTILGLGIWQLSRSVIAGQRIAILRVGAGPDALAATRDGEIWVADAAAGWIDELAEPLVGGQGGGTRTLGRPDALVASPRRRVFYADNGLQISSISSFDLASQNIGPARVGPSVLAIGPDGKTLYVASEYSDLVRPLSTATGHAGPSVSAGKDPVAMTVSPDGRELYVASELGYSIAVISTDPWRREAVIPISGNADALAISPGGAWLYVADLSDNSVLVVNTVTRRVRAVIPVGRRPVALAITPDGRTLYVANIADNTVTPVNTVTRSAGAPVPVGNEPDALAITPDGHYLYVANFGDNTVSQLQINGAGGG